MPFERQRGEFLLSAEPGRLDLDAIHGFLSRSYWGKARPRAVLERSIRHSLCFGIYREWEQIGFARVVTDFGTFAYLADVYVIESYRGRGLGKWMVESILAHPDLAGMRRWLLATKDAHGLYRRHGFRPLEHPEDFMERVQAYPGAAPGS